MKNLDSGEHCPHGDMRYPTIVLWVFTKPVALIPRGSDSSLGLGMLPHPVGRTSPLFR